MKREKLVRPIAVPLILAALLLSSCGSKIPHFPPADSLSIEPSGRNINSYIDTSPIIAFIEGLSPDWQQPYSTPLPAPGVTLLFKKHGVTTATVFVGSNWIAVRLPTAEHDWIHSLSAPEREKLERLLNH